jgi:hypothetical protein
MTKVTVHVTSSTGVKSVLEVNSGVVMQSLNLKLCMLNRFEDGSMKLKISGIPVIDPNQPSGSPASGPSIDLEMDGEAEFGGPGHEAEFKITHGHEGPGRRKGRRGIPMKGQVVEKWPEGFAVGARCQAEFDDSSRHRGVIQWLGHLVFDNGQWVGVWLDVEGAGDCNGTSRNDGVAHFVCADKQGIFVEIKKVKVGDYPVVDGALGLADEM